jgi:hypothetical protein
MVSDSPAFLRALVKRVAIVALVTALQLQCAATPGAVYSAAGVRFANTGSPGSWSAIPPSAHAVRHLFQHAGGEYIVLSSRISNIIGGFATDRICFVLYAITCSVGQSSSAVTQLTLFVRTPRASFTLKAVYHSNDIKNASLIAWIAALMRPVASLSRARRNISSRIAHVTSYATIGACRALTPADIWCSPACFTYVLTTVDLAGFPVAEPKFQGCILPMSSKKAHS